MASNIDDDLKKQIKEEVIAELKKSGRYREKKTDLSFLDDISLSTFKTEEGLNAIIEKGLRTFKTEIEEIREGAIEASKQIGGGFEYYKSINKEISSALPALRTLGYDAIEIGKMQENISKGLRTNFMLTADEFKLMGQIEKLGGDPEKMLINFRQSGQALANIKDDLEKSVQVAGQYGVNTKVIFEGVAKMMESTDQYRFENGVEGMSRMAAKAATMGIGMEKIVNFADSIMDPQKAIDAVANFQRLGVAVGDLADPFKLMYMAQSDMEGLTETIAKSVSNMGSFNRETGKMEIPAATRMQMKEMATQLGLTNEEMNRMVSSQVKLADMSDVFDSFGFDVEESDKAMLAQLSEFKDGEYKVKIDGKYESVTGLSSEAIEKLKDRPKDMEDLARSQFDAIKSIRNSVHSIVSGVLSTGTGTDAQLDMEKISMNIGSITAKSINTAIDSSKLRETVNDLANNSIEVSTKLIEMLSSSDFSLNDLTTNLTDLGEDYQNNLLSKMGNIGDNFIFAMNKELNSLPERIMEATDKTIYSKSANIITNTIVDILNMAGTNVREFFKNPSLQPPSTTATTPPNTTLETGDFIIKPLPQDTIKIVDGKIVGGTGIEENNTTNITQFNNEALTTIMQPKNIETISSSVLTQIISSTPIIQNTVSPLLQTMESNKRENEKTSNDLNVTFSPITIRLEGNNREVEIALDDTKIRSKILDMVSDAMTYNYGGKSRI
jgi:hypothetical protein